MIDICHGFKYPFLVDLMAISVHKKPKFVRVFNFYHVSPLTDGSLLGTLLDDLYT